MKGLDMGEAQVAAPVDPKGKGAAVVKKVVEADVKGDNEEVEVETVRSISSTHSYLEELTTTHPKIQTSRKSPTRTEFNRRSQSMVKSGEYFKQDLKHTQMIENNLEVNFHYNPLPLAGHPVQQ